MFLFLSKPFPPFLWRARIATPPPSAAEEFFPSNVNLSASKNDRRCFSPRMAPPFSQRTSFPSSKDESSLYLRSRSWVSIPVSPSTLPSFPYIAKAHPFSQAEKNFFFLHWFCSAPLHWLANIVITFFHREWLSCLIVCHGFPGSGCEPQAPPTLTGFNGTLDSPISFSFPVNYRRVPPFVLLSTSVTVPLFRWRKGASLYFSFPLIFERCY